MQRMMIVDDEPVILDGLYEFFMKADLPDLEIIKVHSADYAIEWLNAVKIDIVLSDICMPGMDGMELIQEIVGRWPRCKVILLTGHDEFNYAHQAIRNPCVVDYLLKTEGMDKIRSAVTRTLEMIALEDVEQYQTQWLRDKLPRALPQLQQQLLLDILRRTDGIDRQVLQDEFDAIQLPFRAEQQVLPVILRIEAWRNVETASDRSLIRYAVANIAEELFKGKSEVKAVDLDPGTIACFVQPERDHHLPVTEAEQWIKTLRFVHGTMESVQQACVNCLQMSVSVIASEEAVAWPELNYTLNRLRLAVYDQPGLGMEKLLRVNVTEAGASPGGVINRYAAADLLLDYLKQRLLEGDAEWSGFFRKWAELCGDEGPEDPFFRLRLLSGISSALLQTLQELGLTEDALGEMDLSKLLHFNIHTRWAEIITFYHAFFEWVISKRSASYRHDESSILSMIHQYIKSHLGDDLSLTRIAQEVSLNPSYLSRWYKRTTGKGISDYILDKKVELSKELLLGTALKMHEISGQLGFSDQHYFFRFFKKTVGCTPQEYREHRKVQA
ncbi:HTH-type transcriptional activator RhaR [Paenibacillus auburnensis]|uniref:HTH-type transcriptional activator RhaR n=1 Tax=Paenibacillus auburnensis TaxID=2905649 RepID=A0ABN8GKM7_9BACL|nr:response regulator [Paenibacillus auburnensis]CAH1211506.1 HTH-type transcriptional activator RhaR [Paenibacillus auburnensis]